MWKQIDGYNNIYFINNKGQVKSIDRIVENRHSTRVFKGRTLTPILDSKGYYYYNLYDSNYKRILRKSAHRLVAQYFVDNPKNKRCVNHIDENKTNNHHANLEWLTHKENVNHGTRNERVKAAQKKRSIIAVDLSGNLIGEYESINEASRVLGLDLGNMSRVLNGTYKQTKGYKLMYK